MDDATAVTCPVCAGSAWTRDSAASRILGLPESRSIQACSTCGQRRLHPQLEPEELNALYSDAYFNSERASAGEADAIGSTLDYVSVVAPGRRDKFARTIRALRHLHPDGKTLLDVGAATGEFVNVARREGLQADGIELSEFAVETAKKLYGVELIRSTLSELDRSGSYDILHLNHVFEHFNDPVAELGHVRRILAPQGVLYIEVPYQFHPVEKLMFAVRARRGEFSLHSLHHPFFYTPATICRLLTSHGFELIRVSLFDPARYDAVTPQQRAKRVLWNLLAHLSIGNYIEIFARRTG
jgi:2-polyprenyl-3-methyl-5-hydroxy-6-metoxy-1,4-benzoquinol methylase